MVFFLKNETVSCRKRVILSRVMLIFCILLKEWDSKVYILIKMSWRSTFNTFVFHGI